MQPIQSNDIPTQRVRKGVDGCFSPLLSRIPQESLGHASCGFQLHRHKQPPACKMVYCASAEKISPHQSCPASAGSVSEGASLSAFRKPNTGSHVTLQREEKNPNVCICWQIWAPTPVWQTVTEDTVLSVFFPCRLSTLSQPSSESRTSQWRHQSASASVLSPRLIVPFRPESSEVCVNSCNLNVLLESGTAYRGVSGGVFQIYRQNATWQWEAGGASFTFEEGETKKKKKEIFGRSLLASILLEIYYTADPIKLTENRIGCWDSG